MERCANCNGELRLSADRKKLVCEYCDSEFYINENDVGSGSTEPSEESLALQLLDVSDVKTFDNDHSLKSFQELCAWINAGDTVETCLDGLKNLSTQHTDWAMVLILICLIRQKIRLAINYLWMNRCCFSRIVASLKKEKAVFLSQTKLFTSFPRRMFTS